METAHKFLAYKNAFTLLYKMQNFVTAAHFARCIVALESSGVSFVFLTCVDFWIKTWHCSTVQKVLPSLLTKRHERSQAQVWSKRQPFCQRHRILPLLRPAYTTRRQPQCCNSKMRSLSIYLCQNKIQWTSLWDLPALWPRSWYIGT